MSFLLLELWSLYCHLKKLKQLLKQMVVGCAILNIIVPVTFPFSFKIPFFRCITQYGNNRSEMMSNLVAYRWISLISGLYLMEIFCFRECFKTVHIHVDISVCLYMYLSIWMKWNCKPEGLRDLFLKESC